MVEVFKTTVEHKSDADFLIARIHNAIPQCKANFDLGDCDRILRVELKDNLSTNVVIDLLHHFGFDAMVLPDDIPAAFVEDIFSAA